MKDRNPTQILPNGAIRYAIYDASGNFLRYDYILAADEPSEEGTALNKANLFRDTTALSLGLTAEAVPDMGFAKLSAAALIRRTPLTVKRGGLVSGFAEGSTIYLPEEGTMRPFIFCKHNYEPELNGNSRGLSVRRDVSYSARWGASNTFSTSDIDAYMTDYPSKFPAGIQNAMGMTTIRYTPMGGVTTVQTTSRKAFPLSLAEYGLSYGNTNAEGSALPNAAAIRSGVKLDESTTTAVHYTRTPNITNTTTVHAVSTTGTVSSGNVSSIIYYRPAFTLAEDAEIFWYEDAAGTIYAEPQYAAAAENALGAKLGNIIHMEQFTYTGTGTFGQANPKTIITGFKPDLVLVTNVNVDGNGNIPWVRPQARGMVQAATAVASTLATLTWGADRISWYGGNASIHLNTSGAPYNVTVIGFSTNEGG